jgi:hypothetical protein
MCACGSPDALFLGIAQCQAMASKTCIKCTQRRAWILPERPTIARAKLPFSASPARGLPLPTHTPEPRQRQQRPQSNKTIEASEEDVNQLTTGPRRYSHTKQRPRAHTPTEAKGGLKGGGSLFRWSCWPPIRKRIPRRLEQQSRRLTLFRH